MRLFLVLIISLLIGKIQAKDFDAELLNYKTIISIDRGKIIKEFEFEILINNRAGEKYTEVEIPYSTMQPISKIKAEVLDQYGNLVKKLKKGNIITRSAFSNNAFYVDSYEKVFTLKHNIYPYKIKYSYKLESEEFIHIASWVPFLDIDIPTSKALIEISMPMNYKIAYYSNIIDEPLIDTIESIVSYKWEANYNGEINKETYMPHSKEYLPWVYIVPLYFKYGLKGSLESWTSFGNWQYETIKGLSKLPINERNKINALIQGVDDDYSKVKILYEYLQDNTRYIYISTEIGGLKPHSAEYVAEKKYGDCKALSNYFKSVLSYVGIQSYYSKIYAGENFPDLIEEFPAQQFNHVILCVPVASDTLWVDCTSDYPLNHLSDFIQNREVFVIKEDSSFLTRTPPLNPNEVFEFRKCNIQTITPNNTNGTFNCLYKGDKYEDLSYILRNLSENEKDKYFRDGFFSGSLLINDYKFGELERDKSEIYMSFNVTFPKIAKYYGNDLLLGLLSFDLPSFEQPSQRRHPAKINYPIYKQDIFTYEIPKNYIVSSIPETVDLNTEFGSYLINYEVNNNKIEVEKKVLIKSGFISNEKYKDFYAFINKIKSVEETSFLTLIKN